MLRASELIQKLSKLPPDAVIAVRGYEEGVDIVSEVRECRIAKCTAPERWSGSHYITEQGPINAVYIGDKDAGYLHLDFNADYSKV